MAANIGNSLSLQPKAMEKLFNFLRDLHGFHSNGTISRVLQVLSMNIFGRNFGCDTVVRTEAHCMGMDTREYGKFAKTLPKECCQPRRGAEAYRSAIWLLLDDNPPFKS